MTTDNQSNDPTLSTVKQSMMSSIRRAVVVVVYERDENVTIRDYILTWVVAMGACSILAGVGVGYTVIVGGAGAIGDVSGFVEFLQDPATWAMFMVSAIMFGSFTGVAAAGVKLSRGYGG